MQHYIYSIGCVASEVFLYLSPAANTILLSRKHWKMSQVWAPQRHNHDCASVNSEKKALACSWPDRTSLSNLPLLPGLDCKVMTANIHMNWVNIAKNSMSW